MLSRLFFSGSRVLPGGLVYFNCLIRLGQPALREVIGYTLTLNTATGIVTTTAPRTAGNLTWLGEFDTPARFDVDQLRGTIQSKNASGFLIAWDGIPVVELRL